jgi:hypothetical protein
MTCFYFRSDFAERDFCIELAKKHNINYFIAYKNQSLINLDYITRIEKPNVFFGKQNVIISKEQWKLLEKMEIKINK